MSYLLDTHIWIWYLLGRKELSRKHKSILESEDSEIWLSPVSVWETHLLIERKRLPIESNASSWLKSAFAALPIREAKLTFSIAERARILKLDHEDPADRFIAATAYELRLTLLSADQRMRECKEIKIV